MDPRPERFSLHSGRVAPDLTHRLRPIRLDLNHHERTRHNHDLVQGSYPMQPRLPERVSSHCHKKTTMATWKQSPDLCLDLQTCRSPENRPSLTQRWHLLPA